MQAHSQGTPAWKLVATLGISGLVSAIVLVGAFIWTQPRILANQAAALEAAIYRVVPGASTRKVFVVESGSLVPHEGTGQLPTSNAVFGAYDDVGKLLGYAIPGEGAGFQDTVKLLYGYDPSTRRVIGMEVLESRETPGLGDKILKDQEFLANFKSLSVEPEIVSVKKGQKSAPNEVDTISGATISSKAVVKIINQTNKTWLPLIPKPENGQEQK